MNATVEDPQDVPQPAAEDHPALAEKPGITNQYFHLIRELKSSLRQAVEKLQLADDSAILDFGCSTMRHRDLFGDRVEYLGADLPDNRQAHIAIRDDGSLPVDDAQFDLVFSTQVLEHVESPALYLDECRRVLKANGRLLLTTHGTFVFHPCPYDYWRWTHMGLQRSLESADFEIEHIEGVCGGLPTALQMLQDVTSHRLPRLLRPLLHAVIQSLMVLSDRLYAPQQKLRNATFFLVIARVRPAADGARPA